MSKMDPIHALWKDAIAAELGTIDARGDAPSIAKTAQQYAQLGFDAPLVHLMKRNVRKPTVAVNLAPSLINVYVKRRDLKRLTQVICDFDIEAVIPSFKPSAYLALARAYTLMRRFPQAAAQWKNLLQCPIHEEVPWGELADFVATYGCISGMCEDIHERLRREVHVIPEGLLVSLLAQIDSGTDPGSEFLKHLSSHALVQPKLLFDLALATFRLGEYKYASDAAHQGLVLDPGWPPLENLLSTIESFRGSEPTSRPFVNLPREACEAILRTAEGISEDEYRWGLLIRESDESFVAVSQIFSDSEDRVLDIPAPETSVVATFSILPLLLGGPRKEGDPLRHSPDPMKVLPYLDWEVPHAMYQRREIGGTLHPFIRVNHGFRDWWFCPLRLQSEVTSGLRDEGNVPAGTKKLLWKRVTMEIEKLFLEET